MSEVVWFIVLALLCALGLWALSQIPNLDATIMKYIRVVVIVLLTVALINVLLILIFAKSLSQVLGHG